MVQQTDRFLEGYDTVILDEAHERSLNIDFLIGYLKRLLPKRPELKVVVTSATIDAQRFSRHFDDAPVIEVSGRMYPVEIRYRPIEEDEATAGQAAEPMAEASTWQASAGHSSNPWLVSTRRAAATPSGGSRPPLAFPDPLASSPCLPYFAGKYSREGNKPFSLACSSSVKGRGGAGGGESAGGEYCTALGGVRDFSFVVTEPYCGNWNEGS